MLRPRHAQVIYIDQVLIEPQGQLRHRIGQDILFNLVFHQVIESSSICAHLVQDTSKCPDIRLLVVWLTSDDLGTAIRQGAHLLIHEAIVSGQNTTDPKVCKFGLVVRPCHQDVLGFEVSMHYAHIMNYLQGLTNLDEHFPNAMFPHLGQVTGPLHMGVHPL